MGHIAEYIEGRSHRVIALIIALTVALGLLAACDQDRPTPEPTTNGAVGALSGQASNSQQAPSAPAPTPTPFTPQGNLVLWHSWAGADADALTQILAQIRADAPQLGVETLYVAPNDLPQAYADAVMAGSGPDVAITQNWWLSDLVDAGVVRPLNPYLANYPDQYVPGALQDFQRNGAIYGLPTTYETVALFTNRALAPNGAPATTEELIAQATISPTLGLGLYANLYHTWWGFPAYGSSLFDQTGKVVLDQTGDAAGYLGWVKRLSETPGSFVDSDYGMLIDRFKKGEFAYFVDGPWATAELRAALGENLAVAPLPGGPAGAGQPWISAEGVVINPLINEQQALNAWYLASRLTDAQAGTAFAQVAGRLPANSNATLPSDPVLLGFAQQATLAQPAPAQNEMESVWGYGGDMLIKVLGGSQEPQQAVIETAALINEETGK